MEQRTTKVHTVVMTRHRWMLVVGWVVFPVVLILVTIRVVAKDEGMRFENFRVPEYDENNKKKSELVGEEAVVLSDGKVDITNFQLEMYKQGSNMEMRVSAPQCIYNQSKQIAKSKTDVKIEGEKFTVTGKGFAWDGTRELFKIFADAKVVLQRDESKMEQLKLGGSGEKHEE